jgi:hypothetical protein
MAHGVTSLMSGGSTRRAPGTEHWAAGALCADHEPPVRQGVGHPLSCPSPMAPPRLWRVASPRPSGHFASCCGVASPGTHNNTCCGSVAFCLRLVCIP